jgi:hypothetical protein
VLALSGCAGIPVATYMLVGQAALGVASSMYCDNLTEEARQLARDKVTHGVQVIPCEPLAK